MLSALAAPTIPLGVSQPWRAYYRRLFLMSNISLTFFDSSIKAFPRDLRAANEHHPAPTSIPGRSTLSTRRPLKGELVIAVVDRHHIVGQVTAFGHAPGDGVFQFLLDGMERADRRRSPLPATPFRWEESRLQPTGPRMITLGTQPRAASTIPASCPGMPCVQRWLPHRQQRYNECRRAPSTTQDSPKWLIF